MAALNGGAGGEAIGRIPGSAALYCRALQLTALDCVALALMTKYNLLDEGEWKLAALAALAKAACFETQCPTSLR